jgi:hypothetical protein
MDDWDKQLRIVNILTHENNISFLFIVPFLLRAKVTLNEPKYNPLTFRVSSVAKCSSHAQFSVSSSHPFRVEGFSCPHFVSIAFASCEW